MALVVDKTVKYLNVPDANNFTFQCSKPMSQLTADDVKSADFWVGFTSFAHNQMCEGNVESGLPQNDPDHCWCWATDPSALYDGDWSTAHWSFPANYPTGIYMRNILVECASAHSQNVSLQNDASARIIMNIEAGEDTKLQDLYISGSSYVTCPYGNENRVTDYRYIKPAVLLIVNDVLYVWIQSFAPYMTGFYCNSTTSQGYRSTQSFDDFSKLANHYLGLGWTRALQTGDMYTDSGSTTSVNFNYTVSDVDFNGVTADLNVSLGSANYNKRASVSIIDNEDKEIEKWYTAFTGFKFKVDDVWYKPIVTDGIVTGYTDDMTVTSEWDEWDNITGHNVPVTPPVPPAPTGDNIDDMNMNALWAMSSDAGFARYFLLSHDQLASLMTWLSDTTFPDGYDPYPYILSLLQFPLKLSPNWCMPRTPAGHIVIGGEDTGITASLIGTEKAWVGAGTYDVPQLNGNFLDYDPYTQYELYLPCCGWVSLPDIVCGRKIAVKFNYDLTTAAIIGNVYVTIDGKEMIVASKSGMMGRETIVTGEAQGVRSAQITSALLNAGTGALNVATGAMSGNAVAAVSGGYNIVAGLAQANIAANSAYTRTIGSTGGRALLCQFDQCYLKICTTRADIPDNYGHTCGYVCNVSGKVSAFTGYTVFDNVDVSGIGKATDREKKLIKQILETGVIINPTE